MKGNVVIGFTTNSYLMLDCDLQREEDVLRFAEEYAKFHKLGSSLVMETSNPKQMELDLKHLLKNFCVIFGKRIAWEENKWHVKEAYRLGMVTKGFLAIREFGSTTIRTNPKNPSVPAPKFVDYFENGDKEGIYAYLKFWKLTRGLGK